MARITTRDIVDILTDIAAKLKTEFPAKTMERVLSLKEDLDFVRARLPDDQRMAVGKLSDDLKLFTERKFKDRITAEKFFDKTVLANYAANLANTRQKGLQLAADRIVKGIKQRDARRVMESL